MHFVPSLLHFTFIVPDNGHLFNYLLSGRQLSESSSSAVYHFILFDLDTGLYFPLVTVIPCSSCVTNMSELCQDFLFSDYCIPFISLLAATCLST